MKLDWNSFSDVRVHFVNGRGDHVCARSICITSQSVQKGVSVWDTLPHDCESSVIAEGLSNTEQNLIRQYNDAADDISYVTVVSGRYYQL